VAVTSTSRATLSRFFCTAELGQLPRTPSYPLDRLTKRQTAA
jgi:hypothetical protein